MPAANRGTSSGQGYVDRIAREFGFQCSSIERLAAIVNLRLEGLLGLVDFLTGLGSLIRRQRTK
jgi:hypothetical protein